MNLIVRKTGTIFDFCESSNGTDYDGIIYGGSSVKLAYTNDTLKVLVDGGEEKSYSLAQLNYDDGNEVIGFASILELIAALKYAGFTGNFNSGGGSPQLNYKEAVVNYFIEEGVITTNVINSNLVQLPNVILVDDINKGVYLYFTNFGVNTENRLFIDTNSKSNIQKSGDTINKNTESIEVNHIDGEVIYQSFLNDVPRDISNSLNITFKITIYD